MTLQTSEPGKKVAPRRWRGSWRPFMKWKLRRAVFVRDDWTCQICGRKVARERNLKRLGLLPDQEAHCDHIIPKAKGGLDDKENLQTLCKLCNVEKLDYFVPVGINVYNTRVEQLNHLDLINA